MEEVNLFWFGLFLEVGFVLLILWLVRPASETGDRLWAKMTQLKKDYHWRQQELQQQKTQLGQECTRLRQELQKQNDQLMQEHLQQQQEWNQREEKLVKDCARLMQERDRLIDERDQLVHEFEHQKAQLTQDCIRLQQELEQQKVQLIEEYIRLQQELQHQQAHLTEEWRQATFRQLQRLLVNYPSAIKIAHARPDLPAKSLATMFTPLENLLKDWGYETIGPIWGKVAYDPQLHQPDSPDIQPGESVYVRFIGYRQGKTVLCPAKVSRILPGLKTGLKK
ncbi:MAG: hypothetical protein K6T90_11295 [Leptolyngbyaceae cyanobacterium HOT.MB2.61]|jgi:hypothetical protein|nr:hypothetical protein [Leptolyngbyaceae cyanobacterium HOT.MB2.61]